MMHNMDVLIKLSRIVLGNRLSIIYKIALFESVPLGVKSAQS